MPIVNFSSLMLAPELIRIQEKPSANWITPAKVEAIRGEFVRQCDKLDGLADGIINNYMACRAIFDMSQGTPDRNPWAAKALSRTTSIRIRPTRAPNACLTDGQISTLKFVYSRYKFATPLANGVKTFGMWVPNTDPSGSGLIAECAIQRTGRRGGERAESFASGCSRRDRIPDEEHQAPILSTTSKAATRMRGAKRSRHGWIPPIPICPRSPGAAER